MPASAPAMASPLTRLDHALEIAYAVALRSRPRAVGLESWAVPHQLLVVVPKGGLHFHQPDCPRARHTKRTSCHSPEPCGSRSGAVRYAGLYADRVGVT